MGATGYLNGPKTMTPSNSALGVQTPASVLTTDQCTKSCTSTAQVLAGKCPATGTSPAPTVKIDQSNTDVTTASTSGQSAFGCTGSITTGLTSAGSPIIGMATPGVVGYSGSSRA